MKRSSLVLPSAYDEEEGKRPSPRSKAARRQAGTRSGKKKLPAKR